MTVTLEILNGPEYTTDEDGWENHAYTIRLRCRNRIMDTEWHQGLGITDDPTAESVLENLLSSADSVEYDSFEEWAENCGYDPDSRKAERIYDAVVLQSSKLRFMLGEEWEKLGQYDDHEQAAKALAAN